MWIYLETLWSTQIGCFFFHFYFLFLIVSFNVGMGTSSLLISFLHVQFYLENFLIIEFDGLWTCDAKLKHLLWMMFRKFCKFANKFWWKGCFSEDVFRANASFQTL